MSKLLKLKRWLTLDEAANHIATVISEPVTASDLLRMALDGHITLSLNIVNSVSVNLGKAVPLSESPWRVLPAIGVSKEKLAPIVDYPDDDDPAGQRAWLANNASRFESGELIAFPRGGTSDEKFSYIFEKPIGVVSGLWDLPLIGSERLDVMQLLQTYLDGPDVTGDYIHGTFLRGVDGVTYARIMEHFSNNEYCKDGADREKYPYSDPESYYPAGALPNDAQIVMRTQVVTDFIARLLDEAESHDTQAATSRHSVPRADARRNYGMIIAALWAKAHGDGGVGRLSNVLHTAAGSIESMLSKHVRNPPSKDTIGKYLREARGHGIPIGSSNEDT